MLKAARLWPLVVVGGSSEGQSFPLTGGEGGATTQVDVKPSGAGRAQG